MAGTVPGYGTVVTKRETTLTIFDTRAEDGDLVNIELNGVEVPGGPFKATKAGTPVVLPSLLPGANVVDVIAVSTGTSGPATIGVNPRDWIYGNISYIDEEMEVDDSISFTIGLPTIRINGAQHPESARHVRDVLGQPTIFTLDRDDDSKVDNRRDLSLTLFRQVQGIDPITALTDLN